MARRHVSIADRLIRAGAYAFLASFACLGVTDDRMPMPQDTDHPEHTIGAGLQAFPAGLALVRVELYELCLRVRVRPVVRVMVSSRIHSIHS